MANNKEKISRNWKSVLPLALLVYPDWKAPQLHRLLQVLLGDRAPGLSSVQKELTPMRKKWEEMQGADSIDTHWHMGLMTKYHISPEALPYIHLVQNWAENYPTDLWKQPHEPLTIRMVLWISRLYGIIRIPANKREFNKLAPSIAHYLYQWAEAYATRERICELSGTPFDTSSLDKSLREGGEPITVEETTLTFYRKDNSFYIDTIDEKLLRQMEQMKKDGEQ